MQKCFEIVHVKGTDTQFIMQLFLIVHYLYCKIKALNLVIYEIRDSSVDIAMGYELDCRGSIPGRDKRF
jgi:hypothetical protein